MAGGSTHVDTLLLLTLNDQVERRNLFQTVPLVFTSSQLKSIR